MFLCLDAARRVLLTTLILFSLMAGSGNQVSAEEGTWSKHAFSVPRQRAFKVPSPDRKKTVLVQELMLAVTDAGMPVPGIEGYTIVLPAEIAWAPDSKAFVLTANEGGQDEGWYVTVYMLEYDRVNYYDVTAEAAVRFRESVKCLGADEPNFGAIKWLKESKNLLLVAETPARASCSDKNARWGYIVEVPSGKVLSELDAKKLQEDWGDYLGSRIIKKSNR
ncbi:MAG: hypothetical protein AABZ15_07145 [Nitrospirota bacterium]